MTETDFPQEADDVAVGDTGPTVEVADLERRDFVRYAGASGDFNPLHYDDGYARESGHERVFGQGMFTAGVAARVVTRWFGVANVRTYGVRFRRKVEPENTLVCSGEVTAVDDRDEGKRVEADLLVVNEREETVLTGSVTADLPYESE